MTPQAKHLIAALSIGFCVSAQAFTCGTVIDIEYRHLAVGLDAHQRQQLHDVINRYNTAPLTIERILVRGYSSHEEDTATNSNSPTTGTRRAQVVQRLLETSVPEHAARIAVEVPDPPNTANAALGASHRRVELRLVCLMRKPA